MPEQTITESYRAEQQRLHINPRYGVASLGYAPLVRRLLLAGNCKSLSDYGAGKCKLRAALGESAGRFDYHPYDPAFPDYGSPRPAELVACIDVLEHVEPDLLEPCLDDLASVTRRLALLTIHTGPAKKFLSDGRNAHLTQQPMDWWLPLLSARFDMLHVQPVRKGFFVIACPLGTSAAIARQVDLPAIVAAAKRCDPRPNILARGAAAARRAVVVVPLWLVAAAMFLLGGAQADGLIAQRLRGTSGYRSAARLRRGPGRSEACSIARRRSPPRVSRASPAREA